MSTQRVKARYKVYTNTRAETVSLRNTVKKTKVQLYFMCKDLKNLNRNPLLLLIQRHSRGLFSISCTKSLKRITTQALVSRIAESNRNNPIYSNRPSIAVNTTILAPWIGFGNAWRGALALNLMQDVRSAYRGLIPSN